MKKILTLLIFILIVLTTVAQDQYKILLINTPSITINGKELKKGDSFNDPASISWSNERQAIKILDLRSGLQKMIVAKEYQQSKVNTLSAFIKGKKNMSSRLAGSDNIVSLRRRLTGDFYLAERLMFPTDFPTNDKQFFYISYIYNGEEINKKIENEDGTFYITPEIFIIDGEMMEPFDTDLCVYYLDQNTGKLTLITDGLKILVVPGFIGDEVE